MHKLFKENKQLNEFYETSDGRAFYTDNAAKNHARTLSEDARKVVHVKREDAIDEVLEDVVQEVEATDSKEYDLSMTRAQLNEVALSFGIDAKALKSKQDVIDAIDALVNADEAKEAEGDADADAEDSELKEGADAADVSNEDASAGDAEGVDNPKVD